MSTLKSTHFTTRHIQQGLTSFLRYRGVSSNPSKIVKSNSQAGDLASSNQDEALLENKGEKPSTERPPTKTVAQADEELRLKMSGIAGDGGDSGVEYEDGKPVSMKRSVKNNMFRYI